MEKYEHGRHLQLEIRLKASLEHSVPPHLLGNTVGVGRQGGGEGVVVHNAVGPQVVEQVLESVHLAGVDVVESDGRVGAALEPLGRSKRREGVRG